MVIYVMVIYGDVMVIYGDVIRTGYNWIHGLFGGELSCFSSYAILNLIS